MSSDYSEILGPLSFVGVLIFYRPWFHYRKHAYIAGAGLRRDTEGNSWVYWFSKVLSWVILIFYCAYAFLFGESEELLSYVFTLFPALAIKNALIAMRSGIYPVERFRAVTVFVFGDDITKVAMQQLVLSAGLMLLIVYLIVALFGNNA